MVECVISVRVDAGVVNIQLRMLFSGVDFIDIIHKLNGLSMLMDYLSDFS